MSHCILVRDLRDKFLIFQALETAMHSVLSESKMLNDEGKIHKRQKIGTTAPRNLLGAAQWKMKSIRGSDQV